MVKVLWQRTAQDDLRSICRYYRVVKLAPQVGSKIKRAIFQATCRLENNPLSGAREFFLDGLDVEFRYLLVWHHYKVIYFFDSNICHIVAIWDCRNNPGRLADVARRKL